VAGRPEEYFWNEDEWWWAKRWRTNGYEEYVRAALREGTTPNGVFGAKAMWAYMGDFVSKLRAISSRPGDDDVRLLASWFPTSTTSG
jgi:LPS sulfotransferase NodH